MSISNRKVFLAGQRNWESYGSKVSENLTDEQKLILADPQTSGGLLMAVDASEQKCV